MVSGISARSIRNRGVKINNDCNPTMGSTVVTSDIDELSTEFAATKAERTTHPPGGDRGRRERVQEQLQLRAEGRSSNSKGGAAKLRGDPAVQRQRR